MKKIKLNYDFLSHFQVRGDSTSLREVVADQDATEDAKQSVRHRRKRRILIKPVFGIVELGCNELFGTMETYSLKP